MKFKLQTFDVGKEYEFHYHKDRNWVSFLSCDLRPCTDEDKVGLYVRIDVRSMLHVPCIALNIENSVFQRLLRSGLMTYGSQLKFALDTITWRSEWHSKDEESLQTEQSLKDT